ncbi:hypothetical protein KCU85_g1220, partial [Aureobasidium melanogenum]
MYTFLPSHSNLSQNQQKRGLQQVGSLPLSASPQQLSLTAGLLPPSSYATNPYHTSPYQTSTSPFGYHPPPHLQHHQQHSPFQQHPLAPPPQPQQIAQSPLNPRKRRASELDPHSLSGSSLGGYGLDQHGIFGNHDRQNSDQNNYVLSGPSTGGTGPGDQGIPRHDTPPARPKKGRTNTPWTPAEEQRLKVMRDAGNSWSEIAKTFPTRTEGSVKKHWYKDMHYAEFAEDESAALLAAIKEYEQSKWKVIGQKVGKPAKACEQYAKEHFGTKS